MNIGCNDNLGYDFRGQSNKFQPLVEVGTYRSHYIVGKLDVAYNVNKYHACLVLVFYCLCICSFFHSFLKHSGRSRQLVCNQFLLLAESNYPTRMRTSRLQTKPSQATTPLLRTAINFSKRAWRVRQVSPPFGFQQRKLDPTLRIASGLSTFPPRS